MGRNGHGVILQGWTFEGVFAAAWVIVALCVRLPNDRDAGRGAIGSIWWHLSAWVGPCPNQPLHYHPHPRPPDHHHPPLLIYQKPQLFCDSISHTSHTVTIHTSHTSLHLPCLGKIPLDVFLIHSLNTHNYHSHHCHHHVIIVTGQ